MPQSRATRKIAVVGSDEDLCQVHHIRELARVVGRLVASRGMILMNGGGNGIMAAAVEGVNDVGGLSVSFTAHNGSSSYASDRHISLATGMGWGGHSLPLIRAADGVIAIGGGAGTLLELCLAYLHEKPVVAITGSGGWSDRLHSLGIQHLDERAISEIIFKSSAKEAVDWLYSELERR